jgi:hypothetical protein
VSAHDKAMEMASLRLRGMTRHAATAQIAAEDVVNDYLQRMRAAGYVIIPAEMTTEQAARSLAGSAVAERVRVSSPDIYARLIESRQASWRDMARVMGEEP